VSCRPVSGEEIRATNVPAPIRCPSRTKSRATSPVAGAVRVVLARASTVAGASTTSVTVERPTAATSTPESSPVHPVSTTAATATAAVALQRGVRGSLTASS
jgi:hypothetical protein